MDLQNLKDHVDTRFNDLDKKLTDHLQRTASLEASVKWITTIVVIIIGGLVTGALSSCNAF